MTFRKISFLFWEKNMNYFYNQNTEQMSLSASIIKQLQFCFPLFLQIHPVGLVFSWFHQDHAEGGSKAACLLVLPSAFFGLGRWKMVGCRFFVENSPQPDISRLHFLGMDGQSPTGHVGRHISTSANGPFESFFIMFRLRRETLPSSPL